MFIPAPQISRKGSPLPKVLYAISISPTWTFFTGISGKKGWLGEDAY